MAPIDTSPLATTIPVSKVSKLSLSKKRRAAAVADKDDDGNSKRARLSGDFDDSPRGMSSYHNHHHLHHHHHNPIGYMGGLGGGGGNGGAAMKVMDVVSVVSNGGTASATSSKYASTSASSSSLVSGVAASSSKSPSIASLCNLGNTCFLNSVLYTLRFTPGFLHNLHHMVHDLTQHVGGSSGKKRNGFSSNGHADSESSDTEMGYEVIEQLHDLFKSLSCADDSGDSREPIPPSNFLNAVGKLNPTFEGNQQQDAHELLVTILNTLDNIKIPAAVAPAELALTSALPQEKNGDVHHVNATDKKVKKKSGKLLQNGSLLIHNGGGGGGHGPTSTNPIPPLSQTPTVMLPNFVRDNFEGKSVMRTRCLECEAFTYRSEAFTFIDVPLHLDDDDEELSGKDLFLKQIMMSETLRDNNKYWCEECSRLNEAQRSVHYELLPRVMVLQLKRFTATGSKYMSKINEFFPTPGQLPCFCNQCMPSTESSKRQQQQEPKHHYRLYAVIMHLGATLASGHYIAYVRASPDAVWDYNQCQRVSTVERNKKKGILKFLRRGNESKNGDVNGSDVAGATSCRSANCCGIRGGFVNACLDNNVSSTPSVSHQRSLDSCSDSSEVTSSSSALGGSGEPDDIWLECDDESIQVITRKQFEEILSAKQGATTPYLLFYHRV